ncbi:MAG: 4-hydroxythreonine-4-phosphate dehydrogenase PdxA [Ignavibacteria bacterium]|nr:4-hydroxythreonine-4-phosphate dehydrogenase PdxA [Ignavibacteria bacterium]MBT8384009.1 4-hydroxythreonine-4-phosphate dehydrogenase PdxA [Ignavibacteria bacterium]MBT8393188.1 4-hydroxythreonine-4-phosphate dehydrogenase PdxA [Ignavibacteria bacterium]NNJ51912.1 4-hydroxythreonine-4-phosphate dehydrogenase PdxA [Ignavibacteriaceae bacterium]NNL21256.1 4-hydroxythreonine-4-phosphate dehydrogenase PdxA [Ignavibacteriaceae bacterium]
MDKLVFTCGDTNGIGPEIVLKTLNKISNRNKNSKYFFFIPSNVFSKTIKLVKPEFEYILTNEDNFEKSQSPTTIILQSSVITNVGNATKDSGMAAYNSLKASFNLLKRGIADAVVTAPVSKTAFNLAEINFPGQTELFAYWSKSKNYTMMFLSNKLNVALYSIHIPLKNVPSSINEKTFIDKLKVLQRTLKFDLGIQEPRIAVLGLNPHAGEYGIIGKEEVEKIIPLIKKLKKSINIAGPFSSDAFFAKRRFNDYDLTFGLYHDQALIPFKFITAGKGVNFTAGLPIIRTSPDHGVAYDISSKGIADASSIIKATDYAKLIVKNRKKNASHF